MCWRTCFCLARRPNCCMAFSNEVGAGRVELTITMACSSNVHSNLAQHEGMDSNVACCSINARCCGMFAGYMPVWLGNISMWFALNAVAASVPRSAEGHFALYLHWAGAATHAPCHVFILQYSVTEDRAQVHRGCGQLQRDRGSCKRPWTLAWQRFHVGSVPTVIARPVITGMVRCTKRADRIVMSCLWYPIRPLRVLCSLQTKLRTTVACMSTKHGMGHNATCLPHRGFPFLWASRDVFDILLLVLLESFR